MDDKDNIGGENKLVQVYVKSISTSINNKNVRIIELSETNGNRSIRLVLGMFEADFIAAALNNQMMKRPMPYAVMCDVFRLYGIELREIVIFGAHENIFFSKIVLMQDTRCQELTVRVSDALAIAIEMNAPIFVEKRVLDRFFTANNQHPLLVNKIPISSMSKAELLQEMKMAVNKEDYEYAAKVRDEINKRKFKCGKDETKVKGEPEDEDKI